MPYIAQKPEKKETSKKEFVKSYILDIWGHITTQKETDYFDEYDKNGKGIGNIIGRVWQCAQVVYFAHRVDIANEGYNTRDKANEQLDKLLKYLNDSNNGIALEGTFVIAQDKSTKKFFIKTK